LTNNHILKALTAQYAATLIVGGVSFLVSIFIARNIGPQAFGEFATALSVGALLSILIEGGMRNLVLRERTRSSDHLQENLHELPGYALGNALCASSVMVMSVLVFFEGEFLRLGIATVGCFLASTLIQLTSAFIRGDGAMVADLRFQVGSRAISAVLIVLCVTLGYRAPWQILATWALAGFAYLALFCSYWQTPRIFVLAKIYRAAFPFVVLDLAITIYIRSNMIMLNFFDIETNLIGQFAAAFRICEAVIMLASPLGLLIFRYYRTKNYPIKEARKHFSSVLGVAFIISIVGTFLVWMASNQIVELLFGQKYQDTSGILPILSLMLVFVLPNTLMSQAALAMDKHVFIMLAAVLVAVANLIFNAFMIPVYGIIAAAWASVLAEALMFFLMATFLNWHSYRKQT